MKLHKFIITSYLFLYCLIGVSQGTDEKYYFKDTVFNFFGIKIQVQKSVATIQSFKSSIIITNTTENFLIVNPEDVFICESLSGAQSMQVSKKQVVIPPKYSKGFTIKFINSDFRKSSLFIDFKKLQLTGKAESVYEISNFNIFNDVEMSVGPVTWTLTKVVQDEKKKMENLRVDGTIKYNGNKFLGIFHNNISLTTNDGKSYFNEGKSKSTFPFVANKYYSGTSKPLEKLYYDKSKPLEKHILIFPVESGKINSKLQPTIYFNQVFVEYPLENIEGFKIQLIQGTLEDFKGGSDKNDKDIEEVD